MGCAVSLRRPGGGGDDDDLWVSVCRERTRLMKSAVDRRYALAGAHFKYNQSLYAVALAIRLFVARHSSAASSPFLITFPEPSPNPTMHLHHTQSKPTAVDTVLVKEVAGEEEEDGTGPICEHFYDDGDGGGGVKVVDPTPVTMTSYSSSKQSPNEFGGWDFFNPFDHLMVNGEGGYVEEGPKLPAEDGGSGGLEIKTAVADANVSREAPLAHDNDGRELLEALKDVEDHFLKAYESGVEFSKMLEFTNVGPLDHLDFDLIQFKESSEKFIPSLTWHKSSIIGSPSCRSLLSSSSRSSSTWTGTDLFDDNGGMESGSHLSTLGRLYAWEKKLYNEVKAGYEMKKIYDRKSSQLTKEKANNRGGVEEEVNDLYSKIMVSMKICDSISKRIEKVRDEELQPQLIELLHGLMKTWKATLESHKAQSRTMFEVKSFVCHGLTNNASHHLATLQLEAEVQNWGTSFSNYISTTKLYIEALSEWAYRAIAPESEPYSPPPVFETCRDWLAVAKNLPDKAVTFAMKRFAKDIRTLWAQQGIEQQQKRKVDRLVAELEKRVAGFERDERKILESKTSKKHNNDNVRHKIDVLSEKKVILESLRNMVEIEKAKHDDCVQETRRVILVGFQTGFSSVFDSLTEFSEVCLRKYDDVVKNAKRASVGHAGKVSTLSPSNVDIEYLNLP